MLVHARRIEDGLRCAAGQGRRRRQIRRAGAARRAEGGLQGRGPLCPIHGDEHLDSRGHSVREAAVAVAAEDDEADLGGFGQLDLGPLSGGAGGDPATGVAVEAVVEMLDGVGGVAGDDGRGGGHGAGADGQVRLAAGGIELELVEAGRHAVKGAVEDDPHVPGRDGWIQGQSVRLGGTEKLRRARRGREG